MSQSDLDPRLAEFLGKLKPKEVAPVVTPEGFQLIQVMGQRRSGEARSFEEVAPEIRQDIAAAGHGKAVFRMGQDLAGKGPHQDYVVGVSSEERWSEN